MSLLIADRAMQWYDEGVESGRGMIFFAMTKQVKACCSSPAAICYWFIVSIMAWGVLSLVGLYWRPLQASTAACLFAMAIGCLANWLRNRTFHRVSR